MEAEDPSVLILISNEKKIILLSIWQGTWKFENLFIVGTHVPNSGENFKVRRTFVA